VTQTGIVGLLWEKNFYAETGTNSYTLVSNPGPLISDFHFWLKDSYESYVIHVGQEDRFTFIGAIGRSISARFVDCRKGSPTAHQLVAMDFAPDPRRALHIPAGVAVFLENMRHVTIRSEPILFAPARETYYAPGNDTIIVGTGTDPAAFPLLSVNDLPLPGEVLQIINRRQQSMLKSGAPYDVTYGVAIGDQVVRLQADR
jgi:hypothetical protein